MTACEKETTDLERALGFSLSEIGEELSTAEAHDLELTVDQLSRYTVAAPTTDDTAGLLNALKQNLATDAVPARWRRGLQPPSGTGRQTIGLLSLIRPQVSLLGKPFWLASALVCGLGLISIGTIGDMQMIPLVMLAPLLAAVTIVFAFQSGDERVLELETSVALSWQQLALGRLSIVLAVDCLSLTAISLLAVRLVPELSLWLLLLSWFAPLLLWASLALALSLRYGHLVGLIGACAAWGLQVVLRFTYPQFDLLRVAISGIDVLVRLGMLAVAAFILVVAIQQAGKNGRWIAARLPR